MGLGTCACEPLAQKLLARLLNLYQQAEDAVNGLPCRSSCACSRDWVCMDHPPWPSPSLQAVVCVCISCHLNRQPPSNSLCHRVKSRELRAHQHRSVNNAVRCRENPAGSSLSQEMQCLMRGSSPPGGCARLGSSAGQVADSHGELALQRSVVLQTLHACKLIKCLDMEGLRKWRSRVS